MSSSLSRACDRVMEGGWLLAILAAPIYFNVYSSRIFEPDKIAVVRSLALVVAAAWVVKRLSRAREPAGRIELAPRKLWSRLQAQPLLLPVLLFLASYLLSTVLSIEPTTSLWGSYQRLQGLFSLASYVVIGLALAANASERQVERAIDFAVLGAWPVACYGILQFLGLDPIPWATDVSVETRVASTMGNSIFVAAFLIMVVPLVLARLLAAVRSLSDDPRGVEEAPALPTQGALLAAYAIVPVFQAAAIYLALSLGASAHSGLWWSAFLPILATFVTVLLFQLPVPPSPLLAAARVVGYLLLLLSVLACILFSQSRGPQLGLLVGLVVFGLVLAWRRQRYTLARTVAAVALVLGVGLVLLNLPGTPWEPVRTLPYVSRLAHVAEDEGSNRVRLLIWSGALRLATVSPPRTVVGWGPESMYVAYTRFYPAELAQVEKRDATPDRSHNALLDSLVNTGAVGLVIYLLWFGLLLRSGWTALRSARRYQDQTLLAALLAAIVAHLVEIQVGIEIVATWMYLWFLVGVLMWWWRRERANQAAPIREVAAEPRGGGRRRLRPRTAPEQLSRGSAPVPAIAWLAAGLLGLLALAAIFQFNVRPIWADMAYKQGMAMNSAGQWDRATDFFKQATALQPDQDFYYLFMGRNYLQKAQSVADPQQRNEALGLSERTLIRARTIAPLNPDHSANLARLYSSWFQLSNDAGRLQAAAQAYAVAVSLAPQNVQLWNEAAMVDRAQGRSDAALEKLNKSLALDGSYAATRVLLGDVLLARNQAGDAASQYAEAIRLDPGVLGEDGGLDARVDGLLKAGQGDPVRQEYARQAGLNSSVPALYLDYGFLLARSGALAEAATVLERATRLDPADVNAHRLLALVYSDTNQPRLGLREAQAALAAAARDSRGGQPRLTDLQALVDQLRGLAGP